MQMMSTKFILHSKSFIIIFLNFLGTMLEEPFLIDKGRKLNTVSLSNL